MTITLNQLRRDMGGITGRVQHGATPVVITRNGKPALALVPLTLLQKLQALGIDTSPSPMANV